MTPHTLHIDKTIVRAIQKTISIVILVAFFAISVKSPAFAQSAQQDMMPRLPAPGVMVHLSPEFIPAHLLGITIHPDNALQFDFLVYKGDQVLEGDQKKEEYKKLVKYFLASLTIPDEDQWVNLSPYEKGRIIKDDFGKTEMGRDLLAEDYMLKQITSSLIYPEDGLGKKFWDKVYERAWKEYHTTSIPVNTFNKVWIVPDQAYVYESGNTAYILKSHLRVMLEEDYLSLQKHSAVSPSLVKEGDRGSSNNTHSIGSQVIRAIILPELEKEVNEDKNFTTLRQMYSGMILATWYKKALKDSLLGKVYADKAKVKGVDQDPKNNEEIYQRYLKAFKKGVFNYIKEDVDKYTDEAIPRKYFSGGFDRDAAMTKGISDVTIIHQGDPFPAGVDLAALAPVASVDYASVSLDGTNGDIPRDLAMLGPKAKMESPPPMAVDQWRFFASEEHNAPIVEAIDSLISNERFASFPAAEKPSFIQDRIRRAFNDLIEELEGKPGSYTIEGTKIRKNNLTGNRDIDLTKSDPGQIKLFFIIINARISNHSEDREDPVLRNIMADPNRSLGYLADYNVPNFQYLYEQLLRWQEQNHGKKMNILADQLKDPELETDDPLVQEIDHMITHNGKFIFTQEQKDALIGYVAAFDGNPEVKTPVLHTRELLYELQDVLGDGNQEAEALFNAFNKENPDLLLTEKYQDGTPMPVDIANRIKNIFMRHAKNRPVIAYETKHIFTSTDRMNINRLAHSRYEGHGNTVELATENVRMEITRHMDEIGLKGVSIESIFHVGVKVLSVRGNNKRVEIKLKGRILPGSVMVAEQPEKQNDAMLTEEKQTVLIVEDDPDILRMNKMWLGSKFNVLTALNETELRDIMEQRGNDVSLILSDTDLPKEANGWIRVVGDILRKVKADSNRDIPVIALSGRVAQADWEERNIPVEAFYSKPYNMKDIIAKINEILPTKAAGVSAAMLASSYRRAVHAALNVEIQLPLMGSGRVSYRDLLSTVLDLRKQASQISEDTLKGFSHSSNPLIAQLLWRLFKYETGKKDNADFMKWLDNYLVDAYSPFISPINLEANDYVFPFGTERAVRIASVARPEFIDVLKTIRSEFEYHRLDSWDLVEAQEGPFQGKNLLMDRILEGNSLYYIADRMSGKVFVGSKEIDQDQLGGYLIEAAKEFTKWLQEGIKSEPVNPVLTEARQAVSELGVAVDTAMTGSIGNSIPRRGVLLIAALSTVLFNLGAQAQKIMNSAAINARVEELKRTKSLKKYYFVDSVNDILSFGPQEDWRGTDGILNFSSSERGLKKRFFQVAGFAVYDNELYVAQLNEGGAYQYTKVDRGGGFQPIQEIPTAIHWGLSGIMKHDAIVNQIKIAHSDQFKLSTVPLSGVLVQFFNVLGFTVEGDEYYIRMILNNAEIYMTGNINHVNIRDYDRQKQRPYDLKFIKLKDLPKDRSEKIKKELGVDQAMANNRVPQQIQGVFVNAIGIRGDSILRVDDQVIYKEKRKIVRSIQLFVRSERDRGIPQKVIITLSNSLHLGKVVIEETNDQSFRLSGLKVINDNAQASDHLGGINFNSANLDLQIKRDGRGVPLPLAQQDMAQLSRIQGFEPEIVDIKPAINIPIISELQQRLQTS